MPSLQTKNLQYQSRRGRLLEFPDFQVEDQAPLLLLGASGSGKTTLLHLLAGLKRPSAGQILLNGTDICALSLARLDLFRGKHIGLVFQEPHLLRALTVEENLLTAQEIVGERRDRKYAQQLLEQLGVGHLATAMPSQISRGEAQRVAIARALANRPAIVLADEPTASLDDANALSAAQLLLAHTAAQGASLVLATHDQRIKGLFEHFLELQ